MSKSKKSNKPKDRIDAMLDKPCGNPRYGGLTMREALAKGIKRTERKPGKPGKSNNDVQFEL
ncbi:MAG: hypothetical protein F4246_13410 [Rhodothermaceae bacterium]|nr:hypothetical protein [Rhodothermaceae bacterium]MXX58124.1 hypothetical protein [Rhodothermaceae bacterium]MYD57993.1 hypothetical protein [Rhodothermaceae bacterium]MYI43104.1 hypothetical protein [Rhodothermaceae bacterium]MYJ55505.1 hypothetical protein [Rhodothermaceae bacterium]